MKRKWMTGLLAIFLVLTILPIPVQAANGAARVGSTIYDTLPEAIAAAQGQLVELLQDAALTEVLELPDGLVLDGGGFQIYAAGPNRRTPLVRVPGKAKLHHVTLDSRLRACGLEAGAGAELTLEQASLLNSRTNGLTLRGAALTASGLTVRGSGSHTAIDAAPLNGTRASVILNGLDNHLEEAFPIAADNWSDNQALVQVQTEDPRYQYQYTVPPEPHKISFLLPELLAGTQYEKYIKVITRVVDGLDAFPATTVNGTRIDRHVWSEAVAVNFQIKGGTWAKNTRQSVTVPLLRGRGTLVSLMVPKGMSANRSGAVGRWTAEPEIAPLAITGNVTYTYAFTPDPGQGPAARIGEKDYNTLESAMAAVQPGQTVALLRDAPVSSVVRLPAGTVLDGQGHRLYVRDGVSWSTNRSDDSSYLLVLAADTAVRNITLDSMRQAAGVLAADVQGVTLNKVTLLHSQSSGLRVKSAAVQAEALTVSGSGIYNSVDVTPGAAGTSSFTLVQGQLLDAGAIVCSGWETNKTRVTVEASDYPLQQYTPHIQAAVQMPSGLALIPGVPKELVADPGNKNLWAKPLEVRFCVENGSFADGSTVKTLQLPLISGAATLAVDQIPETIPSAAGMDGSWVQLPDIGLGAITGPVTYTFRYALPPVEGDYEVTWEADGALVRPGQTLAGQNGICVAALHSAGGQLLGTTVVSLENADFSISYPGRTGTVTLYFLDQNHAPLADPAVHRLP